MYPMRLLGGGLLVILFFLVAVVASVMTLTVGWLLPLKKRVVITHFTEKSLTFLLRVCVGIRVVVDYTDRQELREYMKNKRPLLIVANHQSRWETFYLQSLFSPLISVLKRELLAIPVFGWALACYWPVALDRAKAVASVKKVASEGKKRFAAGFNVLIFPQATRLTPGKVGHISSSAAKLAVSSGAVLVPVVHNAAQHWSRGNFVNFTPGTIRVYVGAPLDCQGKSVKEVANYYQEFFTSRISLQR